MLGLCCLAVLIFLKFLIYIVVSLTPDTLMGVFCQLGLRLRGTWVKVGVGWVEWTVLEGVIIIGC